MKRLQITLDDDLYEWLTEEIKEMRFGSYSHGINYSLKQLKEQVEKQKEKERD
jgi:Arc/MetJ-type ribon-helix-helix transcriptional regulator